MCKELWIDEVEKETDRLVELGMEEDEAQALAESRGDVLVGDRMGELFDQWKDRAKEAGTYHNPLVRQ